MTVVDIYPRVDVVKRELFSVKDFLEEIDGRKGQKTHVKATSFRVFPTPEQTIESSLFLPFSALVFKEFTQWFIERAFDFAGEGMPDRIDGYIGTIGESGQFVDYLHSDPMDLRITTTICDLPGVNPSTLCLPPNFICKNGNSENIPPISSFLPQSPEGAITKFVKGQMHMEKTLPIGTAKLFLSASYRY